LVDFTLGKHRQKLTKIAFAFFVLLYGTGISKAQTEPDFTWANTSYFNLKVGESIEYNSVEIQLLSLHNHFNKVKVGNDTLLLKVSRRSLPVVSNGIRLFIADNKNVRSLSDDESFHGLLEKDALICLSDISSKMLDPNKYVFPISFNDGFIWSAEEDTYMFSYQDSEEGNNGIFASYAGIGIDLNDARGIEKHWIVAIENSTVVWVEDKRLDKMGKEACVLLQSEADSNIYYLYNHLYNKNIEVREGQKLMRGELIGTVWGDEFWGYLQFVILKSDSIPSYANRFHNALNFFPQFYELYFQHIYSAAKSFTRGKIEFGRPKFINRNQKNTYAFEEYSGKGWVLGNWNIADKVESAIKGEDGNARLQKRLFSGRPAKCVNPKNYYDYEVNVKNGVYRIRAKVGDLYLPTWQKVEFEGVIAATYELEAAEQKWTSEKVVKVSNNKLTIRIHIDKYNQKVAGLSEIVFQRAY